MHRLIRALRALITPGGRTRLLPPLDERTRATADEFSRGLPRDGGVTHVDAARARANSAAIDPPPPPVWLP